VHNHNHSNPEAQSVHNHSLSSRLAEHNSRDLVDYSRSLIRLHGSRNLSSNLEHHPAGA
jgi:hypothetical protein